MPKKAVKKADELLIAENISQKELNKLFKEYFKISKEAFVKILGNNMKVDGLDVNNFSVTVRDAVFNKETGKKNWLETMAYKTDDDVRSAVKCFSFTFGEYESEKRENPEQNYGIRFHIIPEKQTIQFVYLNIPRDEMAKSQFTQLHYNFHEFSKIEPMDQIINLKSWGMATKALGSVGYLSFDNASDMQWKDIKNHIKRRYAEFKDNDYFNIDLSDPEKRKQLDRIIEANTSELSTPENFRNILELDKHVKIKNIGAGYFVGDLPEGTRLGLGTALITGIETMMKLDLTNPKVVEFMVKRFEEKEPKIKKIQAEKKVETDITVTDAKGTKIQRS